MIRQMALQADFEGNLIGVLRADMDGTYGVHSG